MKQESLEMFLKCCLILYYNHECQLAMSSKQIAVYDLKKIIENTFFSSDA